MHKQLIVCLFLAFLLKGNAQLIPFGLDVSPEGKILFSEFPPNYNGNLDDTTFVLCNGHESIVDLRNVNYEFLTILEAPEERSTTNLDPSRIYDTTNYESHSNDTAIWIVPVFPDPGFTFELIGSGTVLNPDMFYDEMHGSGLNDSIGRVLKKRVEQYAYEYMGKDVPDVIKEQLQKELSEVDSIIAGTYFYDYLVDGFVFYTYHEDKLVRAIAYDWNGWVQFDSLTYDSKGNLVRFSREHIGLNTDRYCFEYNSDSKLVEMTRVDYYLDVPENERIPQVWKYGYSKDGVINRRSELQADGTWLSCSFQKEPFLPTEK